MQGVLKWSVLINMRVVISALEISYANDIVLVKRRRRRSELNETHYHYYTYRHV